MAADLRERLLAHPGELGAERESIVRDFLVSYLPKRFEISSGFAFDSSGRLSKQLDIIVADAHASPRFETPGGRRFYPCESVVAVGQIRSSLTSRRELLDALENLESVKTLDRSANGKAFDRLRGESINHTENHLHQIFTFLLVTGKAIIGDTARDTLLDYVHARRAHVWPNVLLALDQYLITYCCADGVCPNTMHAIGLALQENESDPGLLMRFYLLLGGAIEATRVSGLPYWEYLRFANEWNATVIRSTRDEPPPLLSTLFIGPTALEE